MNQTPITASNLRIRKSFAKNKQVIEIPNLIELQKRSYEAFLQKDTDPDRRGVDGLNGVFKSVFPIADFNNLFVLSERFSNSQIRCSNRSLIHSVSQNKHFSFLKI